MCYTIENMTRNQLKYAKRLGTSEEDINYWKEKVKRIEKHPLFKVSGFAHPDLMVVTNEQPREIQLYNWGLITPFKWLREIGQAKQNANKTLNCRSETMFEKASFKEAAQSKRCIILVDSFYEYHDYQGKKYPFRIKMKDDLPMALGGLWEHWNYQGEDFYTTTIVTTEANEMMAKIHNNPKGSETHRMPVIIPDELREDWLHTEADDKAGQEKVKELCAPYEDELLEAYTVGKLSGKEALSGDDPHVLDKFEYEELDIDL